MRVTGWLLAPNGYSMDATNRGISPVNSVQYQEDQAWRHDAAEQWGGELAHQQDHQDEHRAGGGKPAHLHNCGGLFGCGDEKGTGVIREDIKDGGFNKRAADRLLHMDEVEQERLDGFLSARGRARRQLLRASGFMSALAAVGPRFAKLAHAAGAGETAPNPPGGGGRVHVVDSNKGTVRLGVFDATLPPILTIDSGDSISFPNTWSHFLNELEPGVPISRLAELRTTN